MVMTKPVGRTFLVLCFKCFCKDKSSPALMKFCWAPEMAREMGRRGVSLRTSKGREDYRCWRFLQKYSFTTRGSNPPLLSLLHWEAVPLPLAPSQKPSLVVEGQILANIMQVDRCSAKREKKQSS